MKHSSISPGAKFVFGIVAILLPVPTVAVAQYRVVVEPSIDVAGIHDDNLFFSDDERPASDFIQRVRPALDLGVESPRWSVRAKYAVDSERYATHSSLSNPRAREHSTLDIRYEASPRLTLALDGAYIDTDRTSELNIHTGLAGARISAQQLAVRPSLSLRISPHLSARAAALATTARTEGMNMRGHTQTFGIERTVTARDVFTVDYEQAHYLFEQGSTLSTNSYSLLAGWSRGLGSRTRLTLAAGPRVTDGSAAPELMASLTHEWRLTSVAISGQQTRTTAIGYAGTLESRNITARVAWAPVRSLTAYATPAIHRIRHRNLEATVYRMGLGARYAFHPLMGVDIAYGFDSQHGSIDPLLANEQLTHGILSVNLTTRWNAR